MEKEKINYVQAVEDALKTSTVDYKTIRKGMETTFYFSLKMRNTKKLDMKLILSDDGDAGIYSCLVNMASKNKKGEMLELLNKFNNLFRYICFGINGENQIWASYDFTIFGEDQNIGFQVLGIVYVIAELIDTCTPKILRCVR